MLYSSIINAGTYKASSIKVAEASKVIENSQRDVNIAFVNELAQIFGKLGINTYDVLDAAGTKWNFLNFKPGLVGGHCIGVDPHYLATKAEELGYYPELIRAGRRINDSMGEYITRKILNQMVQRDMQIKNANALILGITFKENCPDIRNTRVIDVYKNLEEFGINVDVYDPWVDTSEVEKHYGIKVYSAIPKKTYDVIFVAVSHSQFRTLDLSVSRKSKSILFDLKNFLSDRYLDVITL
jgi:UDP-N-acetyl-D-glucosamine/UDP-N-acetyl-D-galactosamine dehydrogenase